MRDKRVAWIGLGAIGLPMAETLMKAGFSTRGFDIRPEAVAAFAKAGGEPATGAADAARDADAMVLVVFSSAQAEQVLFEDGALRALKPRSVVILCTTSSSHAVAGIAERVESEGHLFVDAPVSGGIVGAQSATLSIMIAGSDAACEAANDILHALGDKIARLGARPGQASAMKTVNQLLCGVHIAAAAEALALAEQAGIDPELALGILGSSAASSWMLKNRGPRMLEEEPAIASRLDIFKKDLGIVLDAGKELQSPTPLAELAFRLFSKASEVGLGQKDDSQVVQLYRTRQAG